MNNRGKAAQVYVALLAWIGNNDFSDQDPTETAALIEEELDKADDDLRMPTFDTGVPS